VKLEDGSFRDRQIDFAYLMVFGGICMIFLSPLFNISFLGKPLSFMMVYVWSRRNAFARMNLGGFFSFTAPYLPYVKTTVLVDRALDGSYLSFLFLLEVIPFLI
jgi:Derlin-2/3